MNSINIFFLLCADFVGRGTHSAKVDPEEEEAHPFDVYKEIELYNSSREKL
jgi:hypothetical protein